MKRGTPLACLAGIFGSLSSLALKVPSTWHWPPFAAFVALSLVSMSLFSASLRDHTSLVAAAISISTNLVSSSVMGVTLLGEAASWRLGPGIALTVLGSVLLLLGSTKPKGE
jgi:drug/metabolite transporter (DMT)-like permease